MMPMMHTPVMPLPVPTPGPIRFTFDEPLKCVKGRVYIRGDAAPIKDSVNYLSSGTVFTALQGKLDTPVSSGSEGEVLALSSAGKPVWTRVSSMTVVDALPDRGDPTGLYILSTTNHAYRWDERNNQFALISPETSLATWLQNNVGTDGKILKTSLPDLGVSDVSGLDEALGAKYEKPTGGIPKEHLTATVQSALNKASSALQSETDPTVPSWAKQPNKPTYTASEIGTYDSATIDDKISKNAAHYLTWKNSDGEYVPFLSHGDATGPVGSLAWAKAHHSTENPQFFYGNAAHDPNESDYCTVLEDEEHKTAAGVSPTTRYSFVGEWGSGFFRYQYTVNETPFSLAQWAAIDSGITGDLVPKVLEIDETSTPKTIKLEGGKTFTSFDELTTLVQKGVTRLRYYVTNAASRPVLYTAHLCDNSAIRFDATGTLGDDVYTRSIVIQKTDEGGISVTIGGLTTLALSYLNELKADATTLSLHEVSQHELPQVVKYSIDSTNIEFRLSRFMEYPWVTKDGYNLLLSPYERVIYGTKDGELWQDWWEVYQGQVEETYDHLLECSINTMQGGKLSWTVTPAAVARSLTPSAKEALLDDTVTKDSANGVKSSGIWSWVSGLGFFKGTIETITQSLATVFSKLGHKHTKDEITDLPAIPTVVAPSSSATTGRAADAKATGEALEARIEAETARVPSTADAEYLREFDGFGLGVVMTHKYIGGRLNNATGYVVDLNVQPPQPHLSDFEWKGEGSGTSVIVNVGDKFYSVELYADELGGNDKLNVSIQSWESGEKLSEQYDRQLMTTRQLTLEESIARHEAGGLTEAAKAGLFADPAFKDNVGSIVNTAITVSKVTSASQLAHNKIAVVSGAAGGTVSVSIASYSNGLRRCQLLITDVAEDKAVSLDLPAATYKAVGVVTTTKGDNLYTFQEYDTNMWLVTKEGAASGGGGGSSDVFFLNADGDLVTSEDKLNDDGTVTVDGALNYDGTLTVTV